MIDKLIDECIESIDELEIASENEHGTKCSSCMLYIVLFSLFFTNSVGIAAYFVYSHWYLKKDIPTVDFNTHTETTIY